MFRIFLIVDWLVWDQMASLSVRRFHGVRSRTPFLRATGRPCAIIVLPLCGRRYIVRVAEVSNRQVAADSTSTCVDLKRPISSRWSSRRASTSHTSVHASSPSDSRRVNRSECSTAFSNAHAASSPTVAFNVPTYGYGHGFRATGRTAAASSCKCPSTLPVWTTKSSPRSRYSSSTTHLNA